MLAIGIDRQIKDRPKMAMQGMDVLVGSICSGFDCLEIWEAMNV